MAVIIKVEGSQFQGSFKTTFLASRSEGHTCDLRALVKSISLIEATVSEPRGGQFQAR